MGTRPNFIRKKLGRGPKELRSAHTLDRTCSFAETLPAESPPLPSSKFCRVSMPCAGGLSLRMLHRTMRNSSHIRTTMNLYGDAVTDDLRTASPQSGSDGSGSDVTD